MLGIQTQVQIYCSQLLKITFNIFLMLNILPSSNSHSQKSSESI